MEKKLSINLSSEAIKIKCRDDNCKEFIYNEHSEEWYLLGTEERDVFSSITPSMIKCAEVTNHNGDGIKNTDESNTIVFYPACGAD